MTLKAILENLDGVDEHFHSLYTERDGKFELTGIEGIKTQADVDRLQSALSKEREEHKTAKNRLSQFGEWDANELHTKLGRLEELELTGGKVDDEKVEELVSVRLSQKLGPVERERNQAMDELAQLREQVGNFEKANRVRTIQDDVRKAFANQKLANPAGQEDAMLHAMNIFDIDDAGNVVDKEGRTATQWLEGMKQTRGFWWGETNGTGSKGGKNGATGTNPWADDSLNMTEQGRIYRENPTKAAQLAKAAGKNVDGSPLN